MLDERFWILLGKQKAGELTVEESQELNGLLDSGLMSEEHALLLNELWDTPMKSLPEKDVAKKVWTRIDARISRDKSVVRLPSKKMIKWLAAASVVGAAALLTFFFQPSASHSDNSRLNHVSTQPGSKSRIELPDGTQVWLNGNSRLAYNSKEFGAKTREVTLTGEAFFDVTANKEVPFIIHANEIDIRVTGTAFNVKAYPSSRIFETALIHGSIEITTRKNPDRKILLKPNEKFVIALDSAKEVKEIKVAKPATAFSSYSISQLQVTPGEGPVETVWMNSRLLFNDDRFDQLALKLESWYNVRIHFMDEKLKEKRFTGVIEKETLEQTMNALQLSYPFHYRVEQNEIWISEP